MVFVVVLVLLLIYIPPLLYFKKGIFKKFFHDVLGWHEPYEAHSFDGYNYRTTCKYCGKYIQQDSQGNWF